MRRSGIVRPYPSLAGRGGLDSGVHRLLETPLVLNGAANPVAIFCGADATASQWSTRNAPAVPVVLGLGGSGAAPTPGVASPFLGGSLGGAVAGAGGKYFVASSAASFDFVAHDLVIEVVLQHGFNGGYMGILDKRQASAGGYCSWINSGADAAIFAQIKAEGTLKTLAGPSFARTSWSHSLILFDRSGSGIIYTNAAPGAAVDISAFAAATMASTDCLALLYMAGMTLSAQAVAYIAIHAGVGWLDTHLQATLAAQRFALLTGSRPLISIASATSLAAGGNVGPAYQEKVTAGVSQLHYMGAGSPRFCQRTDANGRAFTGMCVESAATNHQIDQRTLNSWNKAGSPTLTSGQPGPDGTSNAWLVEGITDAVSIWKTGADMGDSLPYVPQLRFKRVSTSGVLRVAAASGAGRFTVDLAGLPDAWVLLHPLSPYSVSVTPFVCGVAPGGNGLYLLRDSGADPLSFYYDLGQCTPGAFSSSDIIVPSTSATTRAADAPHRLSGAAHFGAQGFAMFGEVLCAAFTPTRNHHLWTAYKAGSAATEYVKAFIDTAGKLNVTSATAGGDSGAVITAAAINDNAIRRYCVSLEHNLLRLWTRGATGGWVEATPDTAVDLAGLDTLDWGADEAAANQAGPGVWPGVRYQLLDHPVLDPLPEPGCFEVS